MLNCKPEDKRQLDRPKKSRIDDEYMKPTRYSEYLGLKTRRNLQVMEEAVCNIDELIEN